MSYTPQTDFVGVLRQTSGGVRAGSVPGLDFIVSALQRMGFVNFSVGPTAPTSNQATTAWFRPNTAAWLAEGTLFLWNTHNLDYEPATPALWAALISGQFAVNYVFQQVTAPNGTVNVGTTLLAVSRVAPAATALLLPTLALQAATGLKLQVVDFSTSVTNHAITLTTPDGATIMQQTSWQLLSTAAQLSGITLQPSPDLNAWVIAP